MDYRFYKNSSIDKAEPTTYNASKKVVANRIPKNNLSKKEKANLVKNVLKENAIAENELLEEDLENVIAGVPSDFGEERFKKM